MYHLNFNKGLMQSIHNFLKPLIFSLYVSQMASKQDPQKLYLEQQFSLQMEIRITREAFKHSGVWVWAGARFLSCPGSFNTQCQVASVKKPLMWTIQRAFCHTAFSESTALPTVSSLPRVLNPLSIQ